MKKENQGFTLIELLVVIAIIALLSTVVMAGLNNARQKSRDAKRLADIRTLQSALELYFDICNGYPANPVPVGGQLVGMDPGSLNFNNHYGGCVADTSALMSTVPINPSPGGIDYRYYALHSNGLAAPAFSVAAGNAPNYQIMFQLEGNTASLPGGVPLYATPAGIHL